MKPVEKANPGLRAKLEKTAANKRLPLIERLDATLKLYALDSGFDVHDGPLQTLKTLSVQDRPPPKKR